MGDDVDVRFEAVDATGPEATEAMGRYFAELDARFPYGFDSTGLLGPGAATMGPPGGTFLVARTPDGALAGCGGVQRHDTATAEIKRMWVAPEARGRGLGRRLLAELERECARLGYARVVLDTNATLDEAIAMYRSAGYAETERYNDNPYAERWFTKDLADPGGASSPRCV